MAGGLGYSRLPRGVNAFEGLVEPLEFGLKGSYDSLGGGMPGALSKTDDGRPSLELDG